MSSNSPLRAFVYRALAEGPPRIAAELAVLVETSVPSVRRHLTQLQREGRVDVVGRRTLPGGKSAALWGLPDVCCQLCHRSMDERAYRKHCCPAIASPEQVQALITAARREVTEAELRLTEARTRWRRASGELERLQQREVRHARQAG